MKLLFRLSLLALAAFGAKTLYEKLRPQVDAAGSTGNRIVDDTLRPAFREATASVKNASTHAAHQVADAAQQAVDQVQGREPTSSTGRHAGAPHADDATAAEVDRSFGDHEPLSAMAKQELGVADGEKP
jgi:hypothetical protein